MIQSLLIGAAAGLRAMTPLAAVALAGCAGLLPRRGGPSDILFSPGVAGSLAALAAAELVGDKLPVAPDRTVAPGMMGRMLTGALAASAIAPREARWLAAATGAAAAAGMAELSLGARKAAMARGGQVATGLAEDALLLAATWWIIRRAGRRAHGAE